MTTPTPREQIRRGDLWLVEFDPSRGAEIRKTRPALVVSANSMGRLPLRIVVPVTDWKPIYEQFTWFVRLVPDEVNGLTKVSGADAFQIKSVSEDRFVKRLGNVTDAEVRHVVEAIALCVGFQDV